jgi:general secretion pathway protein G
MKYGIKRVGRGFTLVELLIVMGILGVLSALMIANIASGRQRARDTARKSDFANVKTALRLYYNDYQEYPASSGGNIMGCGVGGDGACSWAGGSFTADGNTYMKKLPGNPLGIEYGYSQTFGGEGFLLQVEMENEGDEGIMESQNRCGVSLASNVYVTCEK